MVKSDEKFIILLSYYLCMVIKIKKKEKKYYATKEDEWSAELCAKYMGGKEDEYFGIKKDKDSKAAPEFWQRAFGKLEKKLRRTERRVWKK